MAVAGLSGSYADIESIFPSSSPLGVHRQSDSVTLLSSLDFLRQLLLAKAVDINKDELFIHLKNVFGYRLVNLVLTYPNVTWGSHLNRNQLLQLFAMIGHSVTLLDMLIFLERIKDDVRILEFLQFPEFDGRIQRVTELPPAIFDHLLQIFRNHTHFFLPEGSPYKHIWEELSSLNTDVYHHNTNVPYKDLMAYTRFEGEQKQIMQKGDSAMPEFSFSVPEQLAKAVGFAEPESTCIGTIIKVCEKDGSYKFYQMRDNINKGGLQACFFTPIDDKGPAVMVFRGSKDKQSVRRDTDITGVGKRVFDEHAVRLYEMISTYAFSSKNANILLTGHSLGAADAQRLAALIANKYVFGDCYINHVTVFAFNSPKLDRETVTKWEADIRKMADLQEPCRIELNFAQHVSDVVPKSGYKNLSFPDSPDGPVKYVFLEIKYLTVSSTEWAANFLKYHSDSLYSHGRLDQSGKSYKLITDGRADVAFQDTVCGTSKELLRRHQTGLAQLSWIFYLLSFIIFIIQTIIFYSLSIILPREEEQEKK